MARLSFPKHSLAITDHEYVFHSSFLYYLSPHDFPSTLLQLASISITFYSLSLFILNVLPNHPIYSYCSVVFWFGDLNYRIEMSNDEVRYLIDKGQYHELLDHDQVTHFGLIHNDIANQVSRFIT